MKKLTWVLMGIWVLRFIRWILLQFFRWPGDWGNPLTDRFHTKTTLYWCLELLQTVQNLVLNPSLLWAVDWWWLLIWFGYCNKIKQFYVVSCASTLWHLSNTWMNKSTLLSSSSAHMISLTFLFLPKEIVRGEKIGNALSTLGSRSSEREVLSWTLQLLCYLIWQIQGKHQHYQVFW